MLNNLIREEVKTMEAKQGNPKIIEACCCCGDEGTMLVRRYKTSKEEMEKLENYRDELKKELAGVEERIQQLKSK